MSFAASFCCLDDMSLLTVLAGLEHTRLTLES